MPLSCAEALTRLQTLPQRWVSFQRAIDSLLSTFNGVLRIIAVLLPIFLLHQLFLWISKDPEKAFDLGIFLIEVFETAWDLTGVLWNVIADLGNAALIPLWNAFSFYIVEPAIVLILEVFSLLFLRHPYKGFIKESEFPYGGFVCDDSVASATWCGRFGAYNDRLQQSGSVSVEESVTFGVATARRLSELAGGDDLVTPTVDTEELIGALDGLSTQGIVIGASAFDVLFAVAYEIFETSAVFLIDAFWTILKVAFDTLKLLVKSGMLQTLLGIGIDFLVILVIEVLIPALIGFIDAITCVMQLFLQDAWPLQFECIETVCFKGSDAAADLLIFTSIPDQVAQFTRILQATLNSRTGQSFTGGRQFDLGTSLLSKLFPTLGVSECANCFNCKVRAPLLPAIVPLHASRPLNPHTNKPNHAVLRVGRSPSCGRCGWSSPTASASSTRPTSRASTPT
jgi:hypothetical protein